MGVELLSGPDLLFGLRGSRVCVGLLSGLDLYGCTSGCCLGDPRAFQLYCDASANVFQGRYRHGNHQNTGDVFVCYSACSGPDF